MKNIILLFSLLLIHVNIYAFEITDIAQDSCTHVDSLTLVEFYQNSNGPNWKITWDLDQPIHTWHGVSLSNDGCVTGLELINIIVGPVHPYLSYLKSLETLVLSGNDIVGGIPSSIGNLSNLKHLYLNNFSGPFPADFTNLIHLETLHLSLKNNGTIGPMPLTIGNLTNLKELSVSGSLSGFIPEEIGELDNLELLRLKSNFLSGPIPATIGQLVNLKILEIKNTIISGQIPQEISSLNALEKLDLSSNNLDGAIPSGLVNLAHLKDLKLSNNLISGSIPSNIGNLITLERLSLNDNQLSGSVPGDFSKIINLTYLNLSNNNLQGHIPKQLSPLLNLSILDIQNNHLSGSIPIELGDLINLQKLRLGGNNLVGDIPYSFANLSQIEKIYLGNNNLSGCFDVALTKLCDTNPLYIFNQGNEFENSFGNFCSTGIGECDCSHIRDIQNSIPTGIYKAEISVISNGLLDNSANVLFTAGENIDLNIDFTVPQNTTFEAKISDCN